MFGQLRNQKGLTLVELMVVVAIIAIIAAVAITVFQDIQKKAKLAADHANVAAMRSAVAIYYGKNNGIFPTEGMLLTLVTPSLTMGTGGNSFHCGVPTYNPADGNVSYTWDITTCP
jgi:type IV pilus assembly protein PilA